MPPFVRLKLVSDLSFLLSSLPHFHKFQCTNFYSLLNLTCFNYLIYKCLVNFMWYNATQVVNGHHQIQLKSHYSRGWWDWQPLLFFSSLSSSSSSRKDSFSRKTSEYWPEMFQDNIFCDNKIYIDNKIPDSSVLHNIWQYNAFYFISCLKHILEVRNSSNASS